jgi:PKD repeat protein
MVEFGTNLATIVSESSTQITVTSPAVASAGTVDVTVTTPAGTSATGSADQFTYSGVTTPVASFSANPTTGTAPLAVQFTDTSTNSPTSWNWSFTNVTGNNTEIWWSTSKSPVLTFGAGNYSIALNASNSAGYDLSTQTTFINVSAGAPYIDVSVTGSLTNWNLLPGINQDTSSVSLTITTNINNWEVNAVDGLDGLKPAHTAGCMAEYDGSSYVSSGSNLTNPLNIAFGGGPPIALSSTPQTIASGTSSGTTSGNLGISQLIETTDTLLTNGHQYRIVVTLTGSQP